MAVLKDLVVHGASRFLNATYFNQIITNKIGAGEGVFNKIIATTGDIGSLDVEDLTTNKATVLSLLDVRGELHTNQWTNSNIATIDGSFYITPTFGVDSGTMTTTANSVTVNGTNFPISSVYVNNIDSDNTAGTVAWTSGSKVLVTGEILVNGTYMPLGTLVGVLDGNATATQIKIKSITDNRYQTAESLAEIGTQSTALPCRNVKVSLYQTSRSSTLYPLGIFMTALGENGKTFLDIYGGGYATSSATAGGFAKPVLRIGNLAGLPNVGTETPTGYGIYTSNGYFSGVIVSTSGKIANWNITNSSIQTGAFNTSGTMYFGTSGISLGTAFRVTNAGVLTATSGTIGGYSLTANYLQSTDGTTGISVADNSTTASWAFWAGGTTTSTAKFRVDHSGILTAAGAKLKSLEIFDSSGNKRAGATTNGFIVYDGASSTTTTEIARFGSEAIIGKTSAAHSIVDSGGMRIYGGDGTVLVADLGYGSTNSGSSTSDSPYFTLGSREIPTATYNASTAYVSQDIVIYNNKYYMNVQDSTGVVPTNRANWYPLMGRNSLVVGSQGRAVAPSCLSLGTMSKCYSKDGIAAGYHCEVNGNQSYVLGYETTVYGSYCFALGYQTHIYSGPDNTIAMGEGLRVSSSNSMVIGRYNDDVPSYLFIIGKGSSDTNRSNALTVDGSGNLVVSGSITGDSIDATKLSGTIPSSCYTDTNTHYSAYLRAGAASGTANAATTTGNTYLNLVENSTFRSGVKLVPGSNMTITSDASGNVTFAASNAVTGVKGGSESTYRTGNVDITAANVGALSTMSYTTITTTSKSVSTSTSYSTLKGVQFAPGLHFIQASCSFPQSSNANRRGGLRLVSGSNTTAITGLETKLTLSNNGETMAHISGWIQPTSTTTYNFQVFQNSGAALTLELVARYHTLS